MPPYFLSPDSISPTAVSLLWFVIRLAVAAILGVVVAEIYRRIRKSHAFAPTIPATLVMLAVLIALVTQVIGDSVARAFSLVGALSIVRFRTVVDDTLDIAFVIFAVVAGMAAGASDLWIAILGTLAVGLVAVGVQAPVLFGRRSDTFRGGLAKISIRVAVDKGIESVVKDLVKQLTVSQRLFASSTSRDRMSFDLEYKVGLHFDVSPSHIVNALNQVDGVQSVECKMSD
jgi:hypothetical protein